MINKIMLSAKMTQKCGWMENGFRISHLDAFCARIYPAIVGVWLGTFFVMPFDMEIQAKIWQVRDEESVEDNFTFFGTYPGSSCCVVWSMYFIVGSNVYNFVKICQ